MFLLFLFCFLSSILHKIKMEKYHPNIFLVYFENKNKNSLKLGSTHFICTQELIKIASKEIWKLKNWKSNRKHPKGGCWWMGHLKFFCKDLYVIPYSFTLRDVRNNLFLLIIGNSNRISNIESINNKVLDFSVENTYTNYE